MKTGAYFFLACAFAAGTSGAQENQTVKAEKMGDGVFMSYVINESGGNYTYAGINKDPWTLSFSSFHGEFKQIDVKERPEASSVNSYYPDEEAFPVTYVYGQLDTHKQMSGYEHIDMNDELRMVILDEWVYFLEKWRGKDNYRIRACLKKGELTGFKLTKKAFGAAKEMEKANHKETLQKYLDEAFKKQSELLPAWQANNRDKIEKKQAAKDRHRFVIDSINGRYWNSADGKKKLNEWKKSPVYIYNDTGVEFLMCHGQGVSTFLKPGEKKEFSCSEGGKVYKGERVPNSANLKRTNILLLDLNGNNCGKTYNASSFK